MQLEKNMSSPTFELDSKIVRAGAGAGKTTQLTQNIYDIATNYKKTHDKWPRLVVTTFTRKATQELKERLIVKACDEKNDGFLEYVDSGANIHISTIHGVLNLFLRNYGHILGWDNSFQIINKREANILAKTIIKEMDSNSEWEFWLEHFSYSDLTGLLLNYYEISCRLPEAIAIDEKHLRELVKKYLKAQQQELRSLAELIISHIQNEKWLKWADYLLKVPENDILDYLSAFGRRPSKTKDIDEEFNESFKTRYERVKKNLEKSGLLLDEVAGAANFFNKFELLAKKFVNKYLEYKKKLSKLEMQDLELISHLILNQESSLGEAFAQEWDYWLIDEYQDTSPLQEALLKKLIGKSPSYIVGDPQQSIYLFRGARSEVFARKEQELINKRERLSKNYRSYSELLSFINDLFSHFEQSFMKMDFSHRYGEPQEERVVAKFYNGNDKKFVAKEVLGLMQQGISPEKICVLSRKNKPLMDMAFFLNSLSLPTHVHASGGFFQRREILDVLSLVRFLVNTSDNENLVGLLRSPWLAIEDSKIIEWTVEWKHWSCSLWQHLKYIKASVVEILEELLEKSEKWGVYTTTEICLKDWGVITYSHYHDASGRRESNIWKLFTQWHEQEKKPGFNIFNFLNQTQLDLSESEGAEEADAVAALEPNCINLMTIHASKGLQFEYVFIIEAGKKPQLSNGAQENNKIHLDENHNFWSFAVPTQEAGKKEKTVLDHMCIESIIEQELRESDRLFYVAVTRAVKNIYISWEGKYDENSWLGRCRFPLQLGTHQKKVTFILIQMMIFLMIWRSGSLLRAKWRKFRH